MQGVEGAGGLRQFQDGAALFIFERQDGVFGEVEGRGVHHAADDDGLVEVDGEEIGRLARDGLGQRKRGIGGGGQAKIHCDRQRAGIRVSALHLRLPGTEAMRTIPRLENYGQITRRRASGYEW